MLRTIAMIAFYVGLGTGLSGCAATASTNDFRSVTLSEIQPEGDVDSAYRLGSGDKLALRVYGEDALGGEQAVGPDGTISVPLIGAVDAAGHTVGDLANTVRNRLSDGFVRNPSVTITVVSYRPFFILGEVNRPGKYEYVKGMSVLDAVATAEGFTYRARKSHVFLKREKADQEVRVDLVPQLLVQPGDTIRVGERYF